MRQQQLNLKMLLIATPVVVAMMLVTHLRRQPVTVDSEYQLIMGTFSRILVVAPNEVTAWHAITAGFKQQNLVDGLMSSYRPDSELSIINDDAYERPVPVSRETFTVLQKAMDYSRLSDGAFDVTIGPLKALWKQAADTNTPPSPTEMAAAQALVGWDKVLLDPNTLTVRLAQSGMKLDLGGIAKGYAIDLALEAMREAGALGAMVDIGGDIRCFGKPPHGKSNWRIAVQDPRVENANDPEEILMVLELDDTAVATSGHYRRFTVVGDIRVRVSHILDAHTGQGSHKLASTTILAPDALTADALATTVSVLGAEKGLALIESLAQVEAIVIPPLATPPSTAPLVPRFTSGAKRFVAAAR